MHLPPEPQHPEPDAGPAAEVAADQGVLLEGGQQAVDHGAVHTEAVGELGDGQTVVGVGEQFEDSEPSVQSLGGFRGHDASPSLGERR